MRLADAISQFLFHYRYEKNLSLKTLQAYETDLRQMHDFLAAEHEVEEVCSIDKAELRAFIRHLHGLLAERSLKRKVATMKSLFHFLEREDLITVSPFRKLDVRIREARHLPRTIPLDEIIRLFSQLRRTSTGCA